jgi:hypothetical protein
VKNCTPLVNDKVRQDGVTRLGVDEAAFLTVTATSATSFVTGIVDLIGTARLLNAVAGRSGKALCDWISERRYLARAGYRRRARSVAPLRNRAVDQPAAGRPGARRVPPDPAWVRCHRRRAPPGASGRPMTTKPKQLEGT